MKTGSQKTEFQGEFGARHEKKRYFLKLFVRLFIYGVSGSSFPGQVTTGPTPYETWQNRSDGAPTR